MSSRILAGAALLAVASSGLVLSGCHRCLNDEEVRMNFELGHYMYERGKFDEAVKYYRTALEKCSDLYDALVGLGNACRERGNQVFLAVDDLVVQGKREHADKKLREGLDLHLGAVQCFEEAKKRNPEDPLPYYGMALLWYQRATSSVNYPLAFDDKRRAEERDRAIDAFRNVLQMTRDSDKLYSVHRYIGLALFAAGRTDEGRAHLKVFHDFMQTLFNQVDQMVVRTPDEQKSKEDRLAKIEKEIEDIREVLLEYDVAMRKEREALVAKGPELTPEEQQQVARLTREGLLVKSMIDDFTPVRLGVVERELKDRCVQLVRCLNQGSFTECWPFLLIPQGEEARVRRQLEEKIAKGARFQNVKYKRVQAYGEVGTVAFTYERPAVNGASAAGEAVLRWRLVAGQWLLVELP